MNRLMGGGEVGEVGAIAAPQHHSAAPSGRSRYASPAKPAAVIAGALADWQGLFWTAFAFLLVIFAYGELA